MGFDLFISTILEDTSGEWDGLCCGFAPHVVLACASFMIFDMSAVLFTLVGYALRIRDKHRVNQQCWNKYNNNGTDLWPYKLNSSQFMPGDECNPKESVHWNYLDFFVIVPLAALFLSFIVFWSGPYAFVKLVRKEKTCLSSWTRLLIICIWGTAFWIYLISKHFVRRGVEFMETAYFGYYDADPDIVQAVIGEYYSNMKPWTKIVWRSPCVLRYTLYGQAEYQLQRIDETVGNEEPENVDDEEEDEEADE
uniref:Uncharacterized protein n=1 Tax=Acrobeloides nanus TaxID=290746 RepID=A0A914CVT6_9BILA